MKRKTPFVAAALAAGLFFYSSCTPTEKRKQRIILNTLIPLSVLLIMVIHFLARVILSV